MKPVRLPARSPNLNAYAERFVLSIKSECLDKLVLLGERHLRTAVREYVAYCHEESIEYPDTTPRRKSQNVGTRRSLE